MALITGFPSFAGDAKALPATLNAALQKVIEQLGGIDPSGTAYAGNLNTANVKTSFGSEVEQLAVQQILESGGVAAVNPFTVQNRLNSLSAGGPPTVARSYPEMPWQLSPQSCVAPIGVFPFPIEIVGVTLTLKGIPSVTQYMAIHAEDGSVAYEFDVADVGTRTDAIYTKRVSIPLPTLACAYLEYFFEGANQTYFFGPQAVVWLRLPIGVK
jgi:hypothetical protein